MSSACPASGELEELDVESSPLELEVPWLVDELLPQPPMAAPESVATMLSQISARPTCCIVSIMAHPP